MKIPKYLFMVVDITIKYGGGHISTSPIGTKSNSVNNQNARGSITGYIRMSPWKYVIFLTIWMLYGPELIYSTGGAADVSHSEQLNLSGLARVPADN